MKKLILYIAIAIMGIACSSGSKIGDISESNEPRKSELIKVAQDHFIRGSVYEMKGQYAEAILEYQEALNLDPSAGIHFTLGKSYLILDKLSMAVNHARNAVKMAPKNIEYNFLLANIFKIADQKDSAAAYYEKIIGLDSLHTQSYYNLAGIYEKTRPNYAMALYEKLLKITGPEWNVLIKIADLNERMGNVDKTIKTVEYLLELNPSNVELKKLLIESCLKIKKSDKAIALANEALAAFPNDLALIEYKANALIQLEKWEEGSQEYLKLVNSDKINFNTKVKIASAYMAEISRDSSLIPFAKLVIERVSKDSTDWQINAYLGEIAVMENNDSNAVKYFSKAVSLSQWNSQLLERYGIVLFQFGKVDKAIEEMGKAVQKFPESFVINIIHGLSLSQKQKHREALPSLERAVNISPNDITALHAYGFTLNQLKKPEAALIYLEKALEITPNDVELLGTVGLIYDSQKNWEKSDEIYQKAITIDSTNVLLLNNYAYSLAERGIKLDEALKMAEIAVKADPNSSSYLDTIGWIYYKLGDFENAKTYILKAIDNDKENATLIDHLGDVYEKMNNRKKARELWRKALELDPTLEEIKNKIE